MRTFNPLLEMGQQQRAVMAGPCRQRTQGLCHALADTDEHNRDQSEAGGHYCCRKTTATILVKTGMAGLSSKTPGSKRLGIVRKDHHVLLDSLAERSGL